ncbi:hypothetical protein HY485_01305, partial [Candidatus Woesearchaeota archaeon]|nr:hypothetical protein [Candidatus Woesearchaeota archaeon]
MGWLSRIFKQDNIHRFLDWDQEVTWQDNRKFDQRYPEITKSKKTTDILLRDIQ